MPPGNPGNPGNPASPQAEPFRAGSPPAGLPLADQPYRKRVRHKPSIRVAALNITSFMDLTFNLLLFFVLTASFSSGEGVIGAKMPAPGQGAGIGASVGQLPKSPNKLKLHVGSAGARLFRINIEGVSQTPADFTELTRLLESLQNDKSRGHSGPYDPDTPILIIPDDTVRWQHVVAAFNAAVAARYSDIGFATATEHQP